jgi:(2Fe-2S) ferredoxin
MSKLSKPSKQNQTSSFDLEGRFLGFVAEGYKLKLLRLATASGEYTIKLPKELRSLLYRTLTPGEWVQVVGYQKFDKGRVKFKAERVVPISVQSVQSDQQQSGIQSTQSAIHPIPQRGQLSHIVPAQPPARTKPATILVCQKSDCCKRGGAALMKALKTELADRGLTDQVSLCGTGCMKQCKAGPNLVMPDKSRYTRIQATEVPALLDEHFPTSTEIAS